MDFIVDLYNATLSYNTLRGKTQTDRNSTKLIGTIQITNKFAHIDNGPGPGRNYGETDILHILASFLRV